MAHPKRSGFRERLFRTSTAGEHARPFEPHDIGADYRQAERTVFDVWLAAIKTMILLNAGGIALVIGFIGTSWNALPGVEIAFGPVIQYFIFGVIVAAVGSLAVLLFTIMR